VHAQHVATVGNFLGRARQRHRHRLVVHAFRSACEPAAPDHDRHAERVSTFRHFLADVAVTEQAEGAAEHAAGPGIFLLVPASGAELGDVVGHAAIERQQQRERQLRDRDGVLAGAVRHVDAAFGCRRDVDGVVAGARSHDQRERTGLEHRRGHCRAAHDQDIRGRFPYRLRQPIVFQVGLIDDVTAGSLEAVDAAFFEFVCNQDFHEAISVLRSSFYVRRSSFYVRRSTFGVLGERRTTNHERLDHVN
jgi:hypothetical protein